jgi:hypothetical protein
VNVNLFKALNIFKKKKENFFTRYERRVEELSKIWGVKAKANTGF